MELLGTWFAFVIVSVIINTIIIFSRKPKKKSVVGVLFGIHLSFIGMMVFFIVNSSLNYNYHNQLMPVFVAIFLTVTGLMISLYEYLGDHQSKTQ